VTAAALAALAGAALALPASAPAQAQAPMPPFQADRISFIAIFPSVVVGDTAFLSGQFFHKDNPEAEPVDYRNHPVTLEASPYPFTTWTAVASTTTDQGDIERGGGFFYFEQHPQVTTRYRVRATDPPALSDERKVGVSPLLSLRARTRRSGRRLLVTLSGGVAPAHDGTKVSLQRRRAGRRAFRTVAQPTLRRRAKGGSRWSAQLSLQRGAAFDFRVVFAGDADHARGTSRTLTVRAPAR
jgi:hypothetical protein